MGKPMELINIKKEVDDMIDQELDKKLLFIQAYYTICTMFVNLLKLKYIHGVDIDGYGDMRCELINTYYACNGFEDWYSDTCDIIFNTAINTFDLLFNGLDESFIYPAAEHKCPFTLEMLMATPEGILANILPDMKGE